MMHENEGTHQADGAACEYRRPGLAVNREVDRRVEEFVRRLIDSRWTR
jgi:hypothetical protein